MANPKTNSARPPIVVVMGHIDHGKTKILDWYRKTKVVESESGGITQHIGAFQVALPTPPPPIGESGPRSQASGKITFIDTPGHEAFSKLRGRGAKVADIAILVVAADEGVKPQTKEAIKIIRANNLPLVVALNKIDKSEANPDRVKQQLAEEEILVESYGGKVPSVEVSAKEGQNMDELLEVILLVAELENLTADPAKPAEGIVVEAHRDSRRGTTATLLVRDGTLRRGDFLAIGNAVEPAKIVEDFLGHPTDEAGPSSPARVAGLSEIPQAGEQFRAFTSREEAEGYAEKSVPPEDKKPAPPKHAEEDEEHPTFNLIIKTDVMGSREALEESVRKLLTEPVRINILRSEIGDVNESDVKLAMATKMVTILAFRVRVDPSAQGLAEQANVRIISGDVIYEILDEAKKKIGELIPAEIKRTLLGRAKILKVFKRDGPKQVVGGRVEEGSLVKNAKMSIQRRKEHLGEGAILGLQQNKQDVVEVEKGNEFGLMINSPAAIEEGDVLEIFKEEMIQRTL